LVNHPNRGKKQIPSAVIEAIKGLDFFLRDELVYHRDECACAKPCAWELWDIIVRYVDPEGRVARYGLTADGDIVFPPADETT
jgi:hypothetical protein